MNWKCFVDFRERHENSEDKDMENILKENNVPFELTHLTVGDYVCENLDNGEKICVERKIINDFVGSVFDGRLQKELLQMEQSFSKAFIVIVGNWQDYYKNRAKLKKMNYVKNVNSFSVNHRIGLFASIACRYQNVKLLCVENDNQFCLLLEKLLEKSTDGKVLGELSVVRRKSDELVYFNILTSFPNLGADKAKLIMDKYTTFVDFYDSVVFDRFEVKGIGEKTFDSFKLVFCNKKEGE